MPQTFRPGPVKGPEQVHVLESQLRHVGAGLEPPDRQGFAVGDRIPNRAPEPPLFIAFLLLPCRLDAGLYVRRRATARADVIPGVEAQVSCASLVATSRAFAGRQEASKIAQDGRSGAGTAWETGPGEIIAPCPVSVRSPPPLTACSCVKSVCAGIFVRLRASKISK